MSVLWRTLVTSSSSVLIGWSSKTRNCQFRERSSHASATEDIQRHTTLSVRITYSLIYFRLAWWQVSTGHVAVRKSTHTTQVSPSASSCITAVHAGLPQCRLCTEEKKKKTSLVLGFVFFSCLLETESAKICARTYYCPEANSHRVDDIRLLKKHHSNAGELIIISEKKYVERLV
jgi:hypothetical protein